MLELPSPNAAALQPWRGAGDPGGPKPRHAPAAFELCSQACGGEEQIPILTVLFGFPRCNSVSLSSWCTNEQRLHPGHTV